jgi:hypothetical protein
MHFFCKISFILFAHALFIPLNSSQSVTHHLHRDYTLGEERVLSPQERQENITDNVLYCSSHRDSPGRDSDGSLWNLNFDHFDELSPLHLVKNNENLCITKVGCYRLDRYSAKYFSQWLLDTIVCTKTDSKKNHPNLLKTQLKRLNISFRKLLTLNTLYICFLLTPLIGVVGLVGVGFLLKI